jgi:hypothetical protein
MVYTDHLANREAKSALVQDNKMNSDASNPLPLMVFRPRGILLSQLEILRRTKVLGRRERCLPEYPVKIGQSVSSIVFRTRLVYLVLIGTPREGATAGDFDAELQFVNCLSEEQQNQYTPLNDRVYCLASL